MFVRHFQYANIIFGKMVTDADLDSGKKFQTRMKS